MFHPKGPTFFELARQALSSTQHGYDLLATKFDYTPFRTPDFILEKVAPFIGSDKSVEAALDICCGTGAAMQMLRPYCQQITGIDFSPGMLEVAREILSDTSDDTEIELLQGEALEMSFDQQFDLAVCFGALGHILPKDEPRFVELIAKALRPGGRFIFVTTCLPSKLSLHYWIARGFNGAMHIRNFLIRPHFIMFYLTFLLPGIQILLEANQFDVQVHDGVFGKQLAGLKLVVATKRTL